MVRAVDREQSKHQVLPVCTLDSRSTRYMYSIVVEWVAKAFAIREVRATLDCRPFIQLVAVAVPG